MIYIVTGEPRSGTSLMMQTLKLLGIPVIGEFIPNAQVGDKIRKESNKLNPKGFYEVGGVVMKGIPNGDEYVLNILNNSAIKIICNGLIDKNYLNNGNGTDPKIINNSKIIWCLRNPKSVAKSQQEFGSSLQINTGEKFESSSKIFKENPSRFIRDIGLFYKWVLSNEEINNRILIVDYDDMLNNTEFEINKIINFLKINPTDEQKSSAILNVDPKLYRSVLNEWSDESKDEGKLAEKLYLSIKLMDKNILNDLIDYFQNKILNNKIWIDSSEFGFYIEMNISLYKSLKNNNKNLYNFMSRKYKNRLNQTSCSYYSIAEEKYTILRKIEIGNLTRNKIHCNKRNLNLTVEECFLCWRNKFYEN
jgi:hypothetical protein